jgi:hypothetical protein
MRRTNWLRSTAPLSLRRTKRLTSKQDLLYHLEITEKLLDQTRLDHGREAHYNRENQLRETKLQDQLRMVKQIMVRQHGRLSITLYTAKRHRIATPSLYFLSMGKEACSPMTSSRKAHKEEEKGRSCSHALPTNLLPKRFLI